jgi:hypothetical protein
MSLSMYDIYHNRIHHNDLHDFFRNIIEFLGINYNKNNYQCMEFRVMCLKIVNYDFFCI